MNVYDYRCRITRIIDGDSLETVIDVGFYITTTHRVRLLGVDAPELFSGPPETRAKGQAAKTWTTDWVNAHTPPGWAWPFRIRTAKADSFGRWLADVTALDDGSTLNTDIITAGHATVYVR